MSDLVAYLDWSTHKARFSPLRGPLGEVVIHTEAAPTSSGPDPDSVDRMRRIEQWHLARKFRGVGYSFLVGPAGTVYEGRGWLHQGAHTQQGRNSTAHGVCVIGHGDQEPATEPQWAALRALIGEGIRRGAVRPDPIISGHRQYAAKSCPGNLIYPHLARLRGIRGPVVATPDVMEEAMAGFTWWRHATDGREYVTLGNYSAFVDGPAVRQQAADATGQTEPITVGGDLADRLIAVATQEYHQNAAILKAVTTG